MLKVDFDKMIDEIYAIDERIGFKPYLTVIEEREFIAEEEVIEKQRAALYQKYNRLVSDRLSHETLMEEIKKITANSSEELHKLLEPMKNETIQALLNVLNLLKKEETSE